MLNKKDLKHWQRSGSLQFVRDCRAQNSDGTVHSIVWNGHPIFYRAGSSDTEVIYKILFKTGRSAEYRLPEQLAPQVILDIGANIGASSLLFAKRFPTAKIFAFEPVPENFALLSRNIAPYPNVQAFPIALGKLDGTLRMFASDNAANFGGHSFYEQGSDASHAIDVEMKRPQDFLPPIGIDRVDLIKIDTEGSEYEILTSFDDSVLNQVQWITGELHGQQDFELLAHLSRWFDLDVQKTLNKRLFTFMACNKQMTASIRF